jgi:hypothetical protein
MNLKAIKLPDVESTTYGQPYQTPDGATVITVAKPPGVFVIKDGKPTWRGATNDTLLALIGVLTGFIAAAFATAAMVKRPPWPDITLSYSDHR